jgi:hypothetical protein
MSEEQASEESRATVMRGKSVTKGSRPWEAIKIVGYGTLMICAMAIAGGVAKDLTRSALKADHTVATSNYKPAPTVTSPAATSVPETSCESSFACEFAVEVGRQIEKSGVPLPKGYTLMSVNASRDTVILDFRVKASAKRKLEDEMAWRQSRVCLLSNRNILRSGVKFLIKYADGAGNLLDQALITEASCS